MVRSPPADVPRSVLAVAARVEDRLGRLLGDELARWRALAPELGPPLESLQRLVLGGGKRLRPAFCYWGFVGAGGSPDDETVIDAGAAFELLQAFALAHDDVMDGSATRRGGRTVHLEFLDRHTTATWRGEPRRFGEGMAILIGDLAHVYADLLLSGAPAEAMAVWHELRIELNIGQVLDVLGTARGETGHDAARRIARYKSGKYTIERPLHVGAALAGRLEELQKPLSGYGDPLGEAFQLRDDMLGAFGDAATIGKPVGDDFREGKPTPLVAIATERADPAQRTVLEHLGDRSLDDEAVVAIQRVLVETGASAAVEASIEALVAEAVAAIATVDITEEARAALVELARYVARRRS